MLSTVHLHLKLKCLLGLSLSQVPCNAHGPCNTAPFHCRGELAEGRARMPQAPRGTARARVAVHFFCRGALVCGCICAWACAAAYFACRAHDQLITAVPQCCSWPQFWSPGGVPVPAVRCCGARRSI